MRTLFLLVGVVVALGCHTPPHVPHEECARGCAHLASLPDAKDPSKPCALSEPTPEGLPCASWCAWAGTEGRRHGVDPVCFERAATCEEADRCVR